MDPQHHVTLARSIADAARAVDGVVDVHNGGASRRGANRVAHVPGVSLYREDQRLRVEVHLVAAYSRDLVIPSLAEAVRDRVRRQLELVNASDIKAIDIVVADIAEVAIPANSGKGGGA